MNYEGKNAHYPSEVRAVSTGQRFGAWEIVDGYIVHLNRAENDDFLAKPRYAFVRCRCRACGEDTEKYIRVSHLLERKSRSCCRAPKAVCDRLEWL